MRIRPRSKSSARSSTMRAFVAFVVWNGLTFIPSRASCSMIGVPMLFDSPRQRVCRSARTGRTTCFVMRIQLHGSARPQRRIYRIKPAGVGAVIHPFEPFTVRTEWGIRRPRPCEVVRTAPVTSDSKRIRPYCPWLNTLPALQFFRDHTARGLGRRRSRPPWIGNAPRIPVEKRVPEGPAARPRSLLGDVRIR